MVYKYSLNTAKENMYDITNKVKEAITISGAKCGIATIYTPHTTSGITINENADPDVVHDLLLGLEKAFPNRAEFKHDEGNSSAHLKASAIGSSVAVIIDDNKPILGTWQSVFFCEFDGPRTRTFYINISAN
ncbi:MAG: secondary thiamine-phosphate synthase enzyme YjbQ [Christensenellaceae bacterium]|jgi:secondary thiamine-phosphate synthase enzyme|nr:secondary thiamine-phosphate synthase enzyme YjbQ [Christensenellaceae bacterium]